MPSRNPSLPEGTDHIIDTNIDLGDAGGSGGGSGGGASAGGAGGTGGGTAGGISGASSGSTAGATGSTGSSSGGTGGGSAFQFDKNGSGDTGSSGKGGMSKAADTIAGQVRDQISTLKSQAGDRARTLADDGKRQTTDFLQTVAQIVADAAGSVESRLGPQYSGFGTKASDSINSLASSLNDRSVDDLITDARSFVTRSPAVAIGVAALVGFAVARVVRSSVAEFSSDGPTGGGSNLADRDGGVGGSNRANTGGSGASGMGAGASGGLDATSGGFGEQGVGTAGTMGSTGVSTGPGSTGGTGNAPTV